MIDYQKIAAAVKFYGARGYKEVGAPWWVPQGTADITKPKDCKDSLFQIRTYGDQAPLHDSCLNSMLDSVKQSTLVASGEQSLLSLLKNLALWPGKWQTTTPCFRNEPVTAMSSNYFLKTELMVVGKDAALELDSVVADAAGFFKRQVMLACGDVNLLEIVLTEDGKDIMYNGHELGSYGVRECEFARWVYGTGCAEPRLSRAIWTSVSKKLKQE